MEVVIMASSYSRTIESMTMTETAYSGGVHTLSIGNYFPLRYPTANANIKNGTHEDDMVFNKIFIATNAYTQGDYYSLFGTQLTVINRKTKILVGDYIKANINLKDKTIRLINLNRIRFSPIDIIDIKYWNNKRISYDVNNRENIFNEQILVNEDCDLSIAVNATAAVHTLGCLEMRIFVEEISTTVPVYVTNRSTNYALKCRDTLTSELASGAKGLGGRYYTLSGEYVIDDAHKDDVYTIRVDFVNIVDDRNPNEWTISDTTPTENVHVYDDYVIAGLTELHVNGYQLSRCGYEVYHDDDADLDIYYSVNDDDEVTLEFTEHITPLEDDAVANKIDLVLPAEIDDMPVVKLANGFLADSCNLLKSLTISENITHIGHYVFCNPMYTITHNGRLQNNIVDITFDNDQQTDVFVGSFVFAWRPTNVSYLPEAWGIERPRGFCTQLAPDFTATGTGGGDGASYSKYYEGGSLCGTMIEPTGEIIWPGDSSKSTVGFISDLEIKDWEVNVDSELLGGRAVRIKPTSEYAFGENIRNLNLHYDKIILSPPDDPDGEHEYSIIRIPGSARKIITDFTSATSSTTGIRLDNNYPNLYTQATYVGEALYPWSPTFFGTSNILNHYNANLTNAGFRQRTSLSKYECGELIGYLTFDDIVTNDLDDPNSEVYRYVILNRSFIQCGHDVPVNEIRRHLQDLMTRTQLKIGTYTARLDGIPMAYPKARYGTITIPHNTILEVSKIVASDIKFEDATGDIRPIVGSMSTMIEDSRHTGSDVFNPTSLMICPISRRDEVGGYPYSPLLAWSTWTEQSSSNAYEQTNHEIVLTSYIPTYMMAGPGAGVYRAADDTSNDICCFWEDNQAWATSVTSVGQPGCCKALYLKNPGEVGIKWWNGLLISAHVKVYPITLKSYENSDGLVFDNPGRSYTPVPLTRPLTNADIFDGTETSTTSDTGTNYGNQWHFCERQMIRSSNANWNRNNPTSSSYVANTYNQASNITNLQYMSGYCIYPPELLTDNPHCIMRNVFSLGAQFHVYAVSRRVGTKFIWQPTHPSSTSPPSSYSNAFWKNCYITTFGQGTERIEPNAIFGTVGYIQCPPSCNYVGTSAITAFYSTLSNHAFLVVPQGCTVDNTPAKQFSYNPQKAMQYTNWTVYHYNIDNNMEKAYQYTKDDDTMTATITALETTTYYTLGGDTATACKNAQAYNMGTFLFPTVTESGHTVTAITNTNTNGFFAYYVNATEVLLPEDMAITEIPMKFLYNKRYMCKTVIPASVTTIGASAYENTDHMNNIDFAAQNITSVGQYAFKRCGFVLLSEYPDNYSTGTYGTARVPNLSYTQSWMHDYYPPFRGARSFRFHDGITDIGQYAFAWSNVVQGEIKLPENSTYTTVANGTFLGNSGITKITMGSNITTINQDAFACMPNLESVTIPATVTTFKSCFAQCHHLVEASILCPQCTSIGSSDKGRYVFADCYALKRVEIPQFTTIWKEMFANTYSLDTVHLESATTIEGYAFRNSGVKEIHIYQNCLFMSHALFGVQNLRRIVVHNGAIVTFADESMYRHKVADGTNNQAGHSRSILEKMEPGTYTFSYTSTSTNATYLNAAPKQNFMGEPGVDGDFVETYKSVLGSNAKCYPQTHAQTTSYGCPMFTRTCSVYKPDYKQVLLMDNHKLPDSLNIGKTIYPYVVGTSSTQAMPTFNCLDSGCYEYMDLSYASFNSDYKRTHTFEISKLAERQYADSGFVDIGVNFSELEAYVAAGNSMNTAYAFGAHSCIKESIVNAICSASDCVPREAYCLHGAYYNDGVLETITDDDGNDCHLHNVTITRTTTLAGGSYVVGGASFARIPTLETVTITVATDNTITLKSCCFAACPNLTTATFNNAVLFGTETGYQYDIFAGDTSLTTVEFLGGFATGVTADILKSVFDHCTSSITVKVPTGTDSSLFTQLPSNITIEYV